MISLSPKTKKLLNAVFPEKLRTQASLVIEHECANNLPFCEKNNMYQLERIRFAVLKLSAGNLEKLTEAVNIAKVDWRDVLVAAGFGYSTTAHEEWAAGILLIRIF